MKKQAESTNREYDRLAEENQKLQVSTDQLRLSVPLTIQTLEPTKKYKLKSKVRHKFDMRMRSRVQSSYGHANNGQ